MLTGRPGKEDWQYSLILLLDQNMNPAMEVAGVSNRARLSGGDAEVGSISGAKHAGKRSLFAIPVETDECGGWRPMINYPAMSNSEGANA